MTDDPWGELPGWARELLESEPVGRLGLLDASGAPRAMPVTFAVAGGAIWSAIDHKPKRGGELARVRWLRADARCALTVDRYRDDWDELAWIQALGRGAVLEEPAPGVLEALADRYPQYRDRPPSGPFLRVEPDRFVFWRAADG